jgi:aspartyl-tRNA(Asn)/glutamyl-tRNA(Gln) amidotransferase subunit C
VLISTAAIKMTQNEEVSIADLRRVAELANLELSVAEEAPMLRNLNSILGHVAQLNELDTSTVRPMAQVSEALGENASELREDSVVPSLDRELVMVCAPDSDHVYFRVPKVIDR